MPGSHRRRPASRWPRWRIRSKGTTGRHGPTALTRSVGKATQHLIARRTGRHPRSPAGQSTSRTIAADAAKGRRFSPVQLKYALDCSVARPRRREKVIQQPILAAARAQSTANSRPISAASAADVLSKAKLSPPQLAELADRLPRAGPLELDRLLSAFAQSADDAVGLTLIAALEAPELRGAVTVDAIKQRLTKYSPAVQAEAQKALRHDQCRL